MAKLSRVFTGAALEDGSRQLCIKVENLDGTDFMICSEVYLHPQYLVDGNINFYRKKASTPEELKFISDQRVIFENLYDRIENIVRVSEGHIATITPEWILSIIELDDKGEIQKKGDWITLKSILRAAGQDNDVDTRIKGSRKLYDFIKQFYLSMNLGKYSIESYQVISRLLMRDELYHQLILGDKDYSLDIDTITSNHLKEFKEYCMKEGDIKAQNPDTFAMICSVVDHALPVKKVGLIKNKQENRLIIFMRMLKKVFRYLRLEVKETTNDPFRDYEIGIYEVNRFPIYFTSYELKLIRKVNLEEEPLLSTQRDVLLFHCLTGCRYRDMIKLSDINVEEGELVYEPEFNVKENIPAEPVIQLVKEARSLIEQYDGADCNFRLFPFISKAYYVECCREILKRAEVKRIVFVHDPKQRKEVGKELWEVFDANVPVMTYRILNNKEEDTQSVVNAPVSVSKSNVQPSFRGIDDEVLKAAISLLE